MIQFRSTRNLVRRDRAAERVTPQPGGRPRQRQGIGDDLPSARADRGVGGCQDGAQPRVGARAGVGERQPLALHAV